MAEIFFIIVGAILVNNFVLTRFLGICPFLGVSKDLDTALGMGMSVIFVMTGASMITWLVRKLILQPYSIEYMETVAFILVIASFVQLVEMVIQKVSPFLYSALGIFLPLITTNCAVLGVTILNVQKEYSFFKSLIFGFSASLGFTLALVIFAGIRERLEWCNIPKPFRGTPIALILAGLLSLAFMGFTGLVKQ
ncbi:MAG: electron transport complex subunit RsxA [bacterium]